MAQKWGILGVGQMPYIMRPSRGYDVRACVCTCIHMHAHDPGIRDGGGGAWGHEG